MNQLVIGWRELVSLPALGIRDIKAKVDSGARTSAIHAVDVRTFERDGGTWAEFLVPSQGRVHVRCEAPVIDNRRIRNTSGEQSERHIVRTLLELGDRQWPIEISLADRERMEFDFILGRTAIRRHRILVDPGRSFLAGAPRQSPIDGRALQKEGAFAPKQESK